MWKCMRRGSQSGLLVFIVVLEREKKKFQETNDSRIIFGEFCPVPFPQNVKSRNVKYIFLVDP